MSTTSPPSRSRAGSRSATAPPTASNLVVLAGVVVRPPERRELADRVVVEFDVATTIGDASSGTTRLTVPVSWTDPAPGESAVIGEGVEVVVVGTVRRRFFRAGGRTQSRTEVVPEKVVPRRRRATVRSLLADAARRLDMA